MKRILLAILFFAIKASAQPAPNMNMQTVTSAPTGACSQPSAVQQTATNVYFCLNGTWTSSTTGLPVVNYVAGDVLCAMGSDPSIFVSGVLNTAIVTTGTDTSLPNSGTWTTTGGAGTGASGTFTASGGNLSTVTVTSGGSGYTSNPTLVPNSGTIGTSTTAFSSCGNTTDGGGNFVTFKTSWVQPANFWSVGTSVTLYAQLAITTATAASALRNFAFYVPPSTVYYNGCANGGSCTTANSIPNYGFTWSVGYSVPAVNGQIYIQPVASGFPSATATQLLNTSGGTGLALIYGNQQTTDIELRWAATGVVSATYVSGGSLSGTGTCNLASFNDSSTATATIAVTGGTAGAITITSRGAGATAAPTTATLSNGTATCSGTATITSTLGGSPGNALWLQTLTAK